jgi:hypothetical protein
VIIVINGEEIIRKARELAQKESECPCPTLFHIAVERGISLKELRDEIRLLISMSDEEISRYD